ncbi:hypothetical protein Ciccas_011996, partial [Cichlidogyrus casuarinus]
HVPIVERGEEEETAEQRQHRLQFEQKRREKTEAAVDLKAVLSHKLEPEEDDDDFEIPLEKISLQIPALDKTEAAES